VGRAGVIAYIGLEIALLSIILTPGITWGDFDDDSALVPISNLVFCLGVGVLIWAAVSWIRARSRARPDRN
jgi:hypothetical protein